jgi:ComF family protein
MIHQALSFLLDFIYPQMCCNCGKLGRYLCKNCQFLVELHFFPLKPTADSALDSVHVAFQMTPPISDLIHQTKYKSVIGIARELGKLLYLHTEYPDADLVTCVPSAQQKQRLRGFNQAKEMAMTFSVYSQIPYQDVLLKKHSTTNQASLSTKADRLQNTQTYTLLPRAKLPETILLIDDVYTTGTTLNSCAEILKKNGAKTVHSLVVAHGK